MLAADTRSCPPTVPQWRSLMRTLAPTAAQEILLVLACAEQGTTNLGAILGRELPQVSRQLAQLRALGMVRTRTVGTRHYYALTDCARVTVREGRVVVHVRCGSVSITLRGQLPARSAATDRFTPAPLQVTRRVVSARPRAAGPAPSGCARSRPRYPRSP